MATPYTDTEKKLASAKPPEDRGEKLEKGIKGSAKDYKMETKDSLAGGAGAPQKTEGAAIMQSKEASPPKDESKFGNPMESLARAQDAGFDVSAPSEWMGGGGYKFSYDPARGSIAVTHPDGRVVNVDKESQSVFAAIMDEVARGDVKFLGGGAAAPAPAEGGKPDVKDASGMLSIKEQYQRDPDAATREAIRQAMAENSKG